MPGLTFRYELSSLLSSSSLKYLTLFNLSVTQLPIGWYGVVLDLEIPKGKHNSIKILPYKFGP